MTNAQSSLIRSFHFLPESFSAPPQPAMTAPPVRFRLDQAIHQMWTGSYKSAMLLLDGLLVDLKSYFVAHANLDMFTLRSGFPEARLEATLGPSCGDKTSTIFGRAMTMDVLDETRWSEVDIAVVAAVVLFNKGLIYHMLSRPDGTEIYLSKAKVLYDRALGLINTCSDSPDDYFWLKSMLLHHLGHILFCLCDRAAEQSCWMDLDQLLSHRRVEIGQHGVTTEELELHLDVILLYGAHRPAPAA